MSANERIERLIHQRDQALAGNPPPPVSRIAFTAAVLEQTDPEIAESVELLAGAALMQALKRRIALHPDVQAARRWTRQAGQAARARR